VGLAAVILAPLSMARRRSPARHQTVIFVPPYTDRVHLFDRIASEGNACVLCRRVRPPSLNARRSLLRQRQGRNQTSPERAQGAERTARCRRR
jgi:hypothetical protein